MPRATWSGSLAFGLVNVPVELFPATRDKTVHFHELDGTTGERIRHRRVAERSGHEVAQRDIVKAYEVARGEYVRVEPDELDAVQPERSHTIEVADFVDLAEIDPRYFRRSYHVVPTETGRRAYWLLHRAMSDAGRVAIGRFVLRAKEQLVAIRPVDEGLLAETMFFADEIRSAEDLDFGEVKEIDKRELDTALALIDSLTTSWDPEMYADTYRQRVLELVQQKARGEEIVTEPAEEPAAVSDLLTALQASVDRAGQRAAPATSTRDRQRRAAHTRPDSAVPAALLEELTRQELYERAAELDLQGRSKMSKAELVKELRKRSLRRVS